ncbi:hypothetical protein [Lichenibacterium dinghuense]|uniref:hypothetical protein n=1 Tax=Lichenibacterium dinghuense TaxID=2895977 RepID=UPI001F3B7647|nr:hypothetical protein [Lichenibacterium sp. 6Y81]
MRFYFSRTAQPHPALTRFLVSGVIEGDSLEAVRASMDALFRDRGVPEAHQNFAFQDLDEVRDAVRGVLVTTTMEADS